MMKSLSTIERTVLEGIENKIKEIDERLQGIQNVSKKLFIKPCLTFFYGLYSAQAKDTYNFRIVR